MQITDYINIFRDIGLDVVSLYFYAYWILYKKYNNKELFVACSLFNLFLMLIVITIVRTDFNIAIGFGLFALLSLVTLRSATFAKSEMAYFFGGVGLAVINGCGIADFAFVVLCNVVVVVSAWLVSLLSIAHSANVMGADRSMIVVLDHIDQSAVNDRAVMTEKLERLFGLKVLSFDIRKIDYVRDTIDIELSYATVGNRVAGMVGAGGSPASELPAPQPPSAVR